MERLEDITVEARMNPHDWGVWCRLARVLEREGHRGPAKEAIDRARSLARTTASWLEIGKILDEMGERQAAVSSYREATRHHRREGPSADAVGAVAYTRLGNALLAQDDVDTAVLSLRVAVRLAPQAPEVHCHLAEALERGGLLDEALAHAERAVDLDFEAPEAHRMLAHINARLGRGDEAIEALRQLTLVAPDDASAVIELSTRLADSGAREEARSLLSRLSDDGERSPEVLLRLGRALASAGDQAGAVKALRETIRMRPGLPQAHFALGDVFEMSGALDEAVVAFEAAVTLDPRSAETHHRLGLALLASGRPKEAVKVLVQASALDPSNAELQASLARALTDRHALPREVSSPAARPVPVSRIGSSEGSFTGDLSVFALAEVLEFLLVQRSTGRLRVSGEDGAGVVDLYQGQIAGAQAVGSRTLRQRLEDSGVSVSDVEGGLVAPDDDGRLARWMVESGRMDRTELAGQLQQAVHDALAEMVSWRRGQVSFHADPTSFEQRFDPELCVDPRWALLELARQADEG